MTDGQGLEKLVFPSSVLVIEDDEVIANLVAQILKEYGVARVDVYTDGKEGLEAGKIKTYDLVILDWILPHVNGITILNRFRQIKRYQLVPFLVISGMIKKKDFSILGDFLLSTIIEKPFHGVEVVKKVSLLFKEAKWCAYNSATISEYFQDLDKISEERLKKFEDHINKSPNPHIIALIAGKQLREKGSLASAEHLLKLALKGKSTQLIALGELGKLCLQEGRNKEAIKIFEKAYEISPKNVDRLCDMGNVALKELDIEKASDYFAQALDIDEENKQATSGQELAGNIESWLKVNDDVPKTYAGLLNAIGISLTRDGKIDEGISHYQSAMLYLEDQSSQAKLAFNLGLAYAKAKNINEALSWFEKAKQNLPGYEKAVRYIEMMQRRLAPVRKEQFTQEKRFEHKELDFSGDNEDFELAGDDLLNDDFAIAQLEGSPALQKKMEEESASTSKRKSKSKKKKAEESDRIYNPSTQSFQEEHPEKFLKEVCPQIEEWFAILVGSGVYLPPHFGILNKLLKSYGQKLFCQTVDNAIKNNIVSVANFSDMFSKFPKVKN